MCSSSGWSFWRAHSFAVSSQQARRKGTVQRGRGEDGRRALVRESAVGEVHRRLGTPADAADAALVRLPRAEAVGGVQVPETDLAAKAAREEQIGGDFGVAVVQIAARDGAIGSELRGLHEEILEVGEEREGRTLYWSHRALV